MQVDATKTGQVNHPRRENVSVSDNGYHVGLKAAKKNLSPSIPEPGRVKDHETTFLGQPFDR